MPTVRLLVYTDSIYRRVDGAICGDVAFTLFLAALAADLEGVTVVGRLDPNAGPAHYPLPDRVRFIALPYYASHTSPFSVLMTLGASMRAFWRALRAADGVWLFGPYLHSQLFALLAYARRRAVVLGVRQDFPAYVRRRRPAQPWMHVAADVLEWSWRRLARLTPTIVVGPDLEARYRRSQRLLSIAVSLVSEADLSAGRQSAEREYVDGLRLLSVGRLDEEKNPLLLADIFAALHGSDDRWRLDVCGDGPMAEALADRLRSLGVSELVDLHGHVPLHGGLLGLYRSAHAFLHVSWTEGFPQVLVEAFASATPVVATAVGGVTAAVGDAALLIPPGEVEPAVAAIQRIAQDPDLRRRLVAAGLSQASAHTLEHETARVASFICP